MTGITNLIQKINKLIDEDSSSYSMHSYSAFFYRAPTEPINSATTIHFPIMKDGDENNVKKSILEWVKHK